jgi:hypothetical protein
MTTSFDVEPGLSHQFVRMVRDLAQFSRNCR